MWMALVACVYVMDLPPTKLDEFIEPMQSHINVGTGVDVTIRELAETLCEVIGFEGTLKFDLSKPDGTPRKLLDVSRLGSLGWQATTDLPSGLQQTYQWFLDNQKGLRR